MFSGGREIWRDLNLTAYILCNGLWILRSEIASGNLAKFTRVIRDRFMNLNPYKLRYTVVINGLKDCIYIIPLLLVIVDVEFDHQKFYHIADKIQKNLTMVNVILE
jgi:hypothetical protein